MDNKYNYSTSVHFQSLTTSPSFCTLSAPCRGHHAQLTVVIFFSSDCSSIKIVLQGENATSLLLPNKSPLSYRDNLKSTMKKSTRNVLS